MLEMNSYEIRGSPARIMARAEKLWPGAGNRWREVYDSVEHFTKREILDHEGVILLALSALLDPKEVLEIGTCWGYSAACIAAGATRARIRTCTPRPTHVVAARRNLVRYPNVEVLETRSQDLLASYMGPRLDLVFVDGDHDAILDDLGWWDWMEQDGFMLFHDYSPEGSARPCRPVFQSLNAFGEELGREPDFLLIDDEQRGMAGWFKTEERYG